ncbi:hypothetical protein L8W55_06285 [Campylobacter sp. FU_520]|uniref:hypothetical protein n=1 Tax=Campylobacter sp. FU_520 TaxID=2911611 RepID=UPI0021E6CDF7|nr:hypothetical protein [Campylobacter sp. FU_520]MCV3454396.1 hypothetical protein [Campylobacter sp. FU_520]
MAAHINSKGIYKALGGIRTSANNLAAHASKLNNQSLNFEQVLQQTQPKCISTCLQSSQKQLGNLLEDIKNSKKAIIKNTHIDSANIIAKLRQEAIMMYDITLKNPL